MNHVTSCAILLLRVLGSIFYATRRLLSIRVLSLYPKNMHYWGHYFMLGGSYYISFHVISRFS
jgi:hypothetical protein